MKRLLIVVAGAVGACAIAVPAAAGLAGNPSFSQRIPVRVPASASVVSFDDHGHAVEVDHRTQPSATSTESPARTAEPGDDRGRRHAEPGDDKSSSAHPEPGDDTPASSKHVSDDGAHHRGHHRGDDHGHGHGDS